jgi:hypothetical protein
MFKSSRVGFYLIFIPIIAFAACASIVSKSVYPVKISSRPDSANVSVTDIKGREVFFGVTPVTVSLKAGSGYFQGAEYNVTFKKDGYSDFSTKINRDLNLWYIIGNAFIGGLIGYLIVDPATGAMWTLDDVSAILLKKKPEQKTEDAHLNVVLLEDVPEPLRSKLREIRGVGINEYGQNLTGKRDVHGL